MAQARRKGIANSRYINEFTKLNTRIENDGKDTWVEYGVGANFNITPTTYFWLDLERTSGATVDEDIRATVGIRHAF